MKLMNREEYLKHLNSLFTTLSSNDLYNNPKKCLFMVNEISFLGFIIGEFGVKVDPRKTQTIIEWPIPKYVKDIQSFLGLASFHRTFMKHFSSLTAPLTNCLRRLREKRDGATIARGRFPTYALAISNGSLGRDQIVSSA